MDGRGRYHLTTQQLKNWINNDIKNQLDLNRVTNTSDIEKPVSLAQKNYIDTIVKEIYDRLETNYQSLLTNKADLTNGVLSFNQLPLNLRTNGNITITSYDINDLINTALERHKELLLSQVNQKILDHENKANAHDIVNLILFSTNELEKRLTKLIDLKLNTLDFNSKLSSKLNFEILSDSSLKISVVGEDGISRSTSLSLG